MRIEENIDKITRWIKEEVERSGGRGVVFGLSGGLDSAVTAALCRRAFPAEKCLGVFMPCESGPKDREDAGLLVEVLDISWLEVPITGAFNSLWGELGEIKAERDTSLAVANLKPRLRMTVLYYLAAAKGLRVAGTSNKSEILVGYFTKHGDGAADFYPLADFLKKEVREMAARLEVPQSIISKTPSGGLWEGQTDEDELGFTYNQLDDYLEKGVAPPEIKEKIERLIEGSKHKRNPPLKFFREDL